jgi:nitroimidazol reductase NimA-like FMN-containing flavoprotein (pyridoxamine 5'-phosphate oxidase superfamily)
MPTHCAGVLRPLGDGWPYIVPLLHVYSGEEIGLHNTAARGHLRTNVEANRRACFEVDEPVKVFNYGRFECDTGLAYRSAIAYGLIRVVDDRAAKIRFFDAFLAKYGTGVAGRPKSFYPRLDDVTVYALSVERVTGKSCPLPPCAEEIRRLAARQAADGKEA